MSNLNLRSVTGKDGQPVMFPTGISIGAGAPGSVNAIGTPGQQCFGLGICPGPLPTGMAEMFGCRSAGSDNYGNYQYSDGSAMVWIPAFYYKWGTGSNGLAINAVSIQPFSTYADVATPMPPAMRCIGLSTMAARCSRASLSTNTSPATTAALRRA